MATRGRIHIHVVAAEEILFPGFTIEITGDDGRAYQTGFWVVGEAGAGLPGACVVTSEVS